MVKVRQTLGIVCIWLAALPASAQPGRFKPGDRVECDATGSGKFWEPGVVIPFLPNDAYNGDRPASGAFYRVRIDANVAMYPEGRFCKTAEMRPAAAAPQKQDPGKTAPLPAVPARPSPAPAAGTLPASRPVLSCPVAQPPSANGSAPNPDLLARVFRCQYGEKPAAPGYDGAVTVDVTSLQIGARRLYHVNRDMGSGTHGTTFVYPVKITFTEKIHYRTRTEVYANSIRIFNFFVNAFGEWQYGSAENIKSADISSIPR